MSSRIYRITNTLNGKMYIGQTQQSLNSRWKKHIQDSKRKKLPFHNAINKYGPENFTQEILEEVESSIADEREVYWIAHYNTFNEGYNCTSGGEGGKLVTEETKKKISNALKGRRAWNKGIQHSQETKEKIRKKAIGRIITDDIKKKLSDATKGIKKSEITKQRMSFSSKFKSRDELGRFI